MRDIPPEGAQGRLSTTAASTLQEQLAARLRAQMESGELQAGDKIPSEHELCRRYGVSRVTVRGALTHLVKAGLIIKRQGKGAFVREKEYRENVFASGSFTDTCERVGAVPTTRIIGARTRTAPDGIADMAPFASSGEAIELTRLRLVDEVPCIVEVDYFPIGFTFLLEEDLENHSILGLVRERTGRMATGFEDCFRIARATKRQAELLDCKLRAPLLKVEQTVTAADSSVIYVNHQFIATERYVYVTKSSKR